MKRKGAPSEKALRNERQRKMKFDAMASKTHGKAGGTRRNCGTSAAAKAGEPDDAEGKAEYLKNYYSVYV